MVGTDLGDFADSDAFIINLRRTPGASVTVASIEMVQSDMRNRYSFRPRRSLQELFAPDLARAFEASLARIESAERIVSLPEFEYAVPGLVLSGLRILVTKIENGTEIIMMRVRTYVGAIKSVFQFDPAMAVTSMSAREKIAVDVLQDIMTPLFDLMALDLPGMDEVIEKHAPAIRKRLVQLNAKQEELVFFTGLLQRYVAGCKSDVQRERRLQDMTGQAPGSDILSKSA